MDSRPIKKTLSMYSVRLFYNINLYRKMESSSQSSSTVIWKLLLFVKDFWGDADFWSSTIISVDFAFLKIGVPQLFAGLFLPDFGVEITEMIPLEIVLDEKSLIDVFKRELPAAEGVWKTRLLSSLPSNLFFWGFIELFFCLGVAGDVTTFSAGGW